MKIFTSKKNTAVYVLTISAQYTNFIATPFVEQSQKNPFQSTITIIAKKQVKMPCNIFFWGFENETICES